jgi:hypothetical protein
MGISYIRIVSQTCVEKTKLVGDKERVVLKEIREMIGRLEKFGLGVDL